MQTIKLTKDLELSRIIHGHWRLPDWKMTSKEILTFIQLIIDLGINTFDHADIYGDYNCEKWFGDALKLKKDLRQKIIIITKCGIKLRSEKYPDRTIKYYDYSYAHIIASVENALRNFNTDYIDILLLHRPSPFFNPEEVAKAFSRLKKEGKALNFGVSNFNPIQFKMLQNFCDEKLVTNQVEISPACLEHFENGNIDFFLSEGIKPMAWSPLGGGKILKPATEKELRLFTVLQEIAAKLNVDTIEKVIYIWLLKHPACILPIAGTRNLDRLKIAVDALDIEMDTEQWFKIYNASAGKDLP